MVCGRNYRAGIRGYEEELEQTDNAGADGGTRAEILEEQQQTTGCMRGGEVLDGRVIGLSVSR